MKPTPATLSPHKPTVLTTVLSLGVSVAFLVGAPVTPAAPTWQNTTIESFSTRFTSSDWSTVRAAKDSLESLQAQAIPVLLALLGRDEYVKLRDTADLIYPGATEFWGHGGVVDYDIDWLSVRAGWALEDLTFQNFGFREGAINHDALLKSAMAGKVDVLLSSVVALESDADVKRERRSRAISAATAWGTRSSDAWNRLAAVVDALRSDDPVRQVTALNWLRHGTTPCQGLSKETFTQTILPEVRRLAGSNDSGVTEQADYLVRDFESKEWYWLSLKETEKGRR
ncbi:MAG TPA: hypothetical protein VNM67_06215 [Thermoanaerobaculia bacterium]|jgi:hypothetical protein|nr:hypothetical protein [Thermoanaerobaculia bacterium]